MMSHNEIKTILQSSEGQSPAKVQAVDDHLATCDDCHAFAQMLRELGQGKWSPYANIMAQPEHRARIVAGQQKMRDQLAASKRAWFVPSGSLMLEIAGITAILILGFLLIRTATPQTISAPNATHTPTTTATPLPVTATATPLPPTATQLSSTATATSLPPATTATSLPPTATVTPLLATTAPTIIVRQPTATATLRPTARPTVAPTNTPLPPPTVPIINEYIRDVRWVSPAVGTVVTADTKIVVDLTYAFPNSEPGIINVFLVGGTQVEPCSGNISIVSDEINQIASTGWGKLRFELQPNRMSGQTTNINIGVSLHTIEHEEIVILLGCDVPYLPPYIVNP